MKSFKLTDQPISRLDPALHHAGALATFDGIVRDLNDGMQVEWLEYEAYAELAEAEGNRVVEEALAKFAIADALCVHRVGRLSVGDIAIRVAVSAAHRQAAFEACQYIVDQVKHRVPIWKKESFVGGETRWVNYEPTGPTERLRRELFPDETVRFDRQMRLPEVGEAGQMRLSASRVLVIGAGGLGCPVLTYLGAAGVGELVICDDDTVDLSNLPRQTLYITADCGEPKAVVAAARLEAAHPQVRAVAIRRRADKGCLPELLQGCDVVLDCTDGWDTKLAINDACSRLRVPLVTASVHRWSGLVWTWHPDYDGGCMRCHMESVEASPDSCEADGVAGSIVGALGAIQAGEAIRILIGATPALAESTLLVDLATGSCQTIARPVDPQCELCFGTAEPDSVSRSVDVASLADLSRYQVVDMRLSGVPRLAYEHVRATESEIAGLAAQDGPPLLLVCERGGRSLAAAYAAKGVREAWSLGGGTRSLDELLVRRVALPERSKPGFARGAMEIVGDIVNTPDGFA